MATMKVNHFLFFLRNSLSNNRIKATSLFGALIAIELTDVVFALDSIPAIFAVTTNKLIVYSSNIFAIMGLRAFYNIVSDLDAKFVYLRHSLSFILIFVGVKILLSKIVHINPVISLIIIFFAISLGIISSIFKGSHDVSNETK
jgi:tellurite resistance protein TerC